MAKLEVIPIPVSEAVAATLRHDPARLAELGKLVEALVQPDAAAEDPLFAYLDSLPRDPDAPELTEAEIQAEIDAARAERRR